MMGIAVGIRSRNKLGNDAIIHLSHARLYSVLGAILSATAA